MPPARSETIRHVVADQALGLEAVFRAVQLIATAVSQLTVDAYRGGAQLQGRNVAPFITRPNVDEPLSAFLSETATSMALSGNAFWRTHRSAASGEIVNLQVLPALEVAVSFDDSGRRTFSWRGRQYDSRDITQMAYLRIPGRARGLGPIQAAQARLRGALDLDAYASDWFHDGGVPTGVLKSDQHLSPEQAKDWRERWEETQAKRGTAVLGNGLEYRAINLSPKDAQFLESQQFSTTALARLFGIPAHLMLAAVEGGSTTYVNHAQADLAFVRWTLATYTREIEEAFTALLPRGQVARFNLDAVLRPDTKARYDAHAIALEKGFLSVDEVRAIEGLDPLPAEQESPA